LVRCPKIKNERTTAMLRRTLLLLFISCSGYSQNMEAKIDSLEIVLQNASFDTTRVKIYTGLASEILKVNPEKAEIFADSAILLASKLHYPSFEIVAYRLKGISLANRGKNAEGRLAFIKQMKLAQENRKKPEEASANHSLSNIASAQGFFDSAIHYANRSLELDSTIKNRVKVFSTLASTYRLMNDYPNAIRYNLETLRLCQVTGDRAMEVRTLMNTGNVFAVKQDFQAAEKYYEQALATIDSAKMLNEFIHLNQNLGALNAEQKDYEMALKYFHKTLQASSKLGLIRLMTTTLLNIGNVYQDKCVFKRAIEYYAKSMKLASTSGDQPSLASLHLNLGRTYFLSDRLAEARIEISKCIDLSTTFGMPQLKAKAFLISHKIDSAQGNYKTALAEYKHMVSIEDSLFNLQKEKQIVEALQKYESEKKAREITDLTREVETQEFEVTRQRYRLNLMAIVFVSLLLVLIAIYFRFKIRQERKGKMDALQQQELIINAQEQIQEKISRELHDNVGQKLVALKYGLEYQQHLNVDTIPTATILLLQEVMNEIRNASHLLSPHLVQSEGLHESIESLLKKSFSDTPVSYEFDVFHVVTNPSPETQLHVYRICQELFVNILKHAQATAVIVQLYQHAVNLIVNVEDNGKGFPSNVKKGFGLTSIESRCRVLNGIVSWSTENGKTTTTIRIPI
jgi:two-component system, NarL family, sensor kinase